MGACASCVSSTAAAATKPSERDSNNFTTNLVRMEKPGKFLEDYDVGVTLGEGITGTVKVVKSKSTGVEYAMKTINLSRIDKAQLKELHNEIRILRTLDHPNIVRLYHTYMDKKNIYIVMEYCQGGELKRCTTENHVRRVVSQILMACSYCHSQGVVHRDLKLENVIYADKSKDSDVKIIDFGLSATFHTEPSIPMGFGSTFSKANKAKRMFLTTCGTAYYMAPEILDGQYTEACDLWAIGVITFMLLTGRAPFDGATEEEVFAKLQSGIIKFDSPVWGQVDPSAVHFIKHLLMVDPKRRWSAAEALESEWLQKYRGIVALKKERALAAKGNAADEIDLENKVVESLERFAKYTKLRKAALMVIAHSVGQSEIGSLKNSFLEYDVNRTGFITLDELQAVLARHQTESDKTELHAARVEELFESLDQDKSGKIRYLEFLAATIETRLIVDAERMATAFDHLDVDNSGFITKANLRKLLGKGFSADEVDQIVEEADLTGDNRISKDEFLKIMGEGQAMVSDKASAMIQSVQQEENLAPPTHEMTSKAASEATIVEDEETGQPIVAPTLAVQDTNEETHAQDTSNVAATSDDVNTDSAAQKVDHEGAKVQPEDSDSSVVVPT